jgi:predicted Zn-ribbon and HTH transcriptional regulator
MTFSKTSDDEFGRPPLPPPPNSSPALLSSYSANASDPLFALENGAKSADLLGNTWESRQFAAEYADFSPATVEDQTVVLKRDESFSSCVEVACLAARERDPSLDWTLADGGAFDINPHQSAGATGKDSSGVVNGQGVLGSSSPSLSTSPLRSWKPQARLESIGDVYVEWRIEDNEQLMISPDLSSFVVNSVNSATSSSSSSSSSAAALSRLSAKASSSTSSKDLSLSRQSNSSTNDNHDTDSSLAVRTRKYTDINSNSNNNSGSSSAFDWLPKLGPWTSSIPSSSLSPSASTSTDGVVDIDTATSASAKAREALDMRVSTTRICGMVFSVPPVKVNKQNQRCTSNTIISPIQFISNKAFPRIFL